MQYLELSKSLWVYTIHMYKIISADLHTKTTMLGDINFYKILYFLPHFTIL